MTLPAPAWNRLWRGVTLRVFDIGPGCGLTVAAAAALLSAAERERAARFHFAEDAHRWKRARALLRLTLSAATGIAPEALRFRTGAFGKPELEVDSTPPVHFNLSHSGDWAAIAVAAQPVGVDIEAAKPLPAAELAAFAFRPEEHAAILSHAAPDHCFLEYWTAKEAVMKCTGQGLTLPPDHILFSAGTDGENLTAKIDGSDTAFQVLRTFHPETWVLAAALRA